MNGFLRQTLTYYHKPLVTFIFAATIFLNYLLHLFDDVH